MAEAKKKLDVGLTPPVEEENKFDLAEEIRDIKGILKTIVEAQSTIIVDLKKLDAKKKAGVF